MKPGSLFMRALNEVTFKNIMQSNDGKHNCISESHRELIKVPSGELTIMMMMKAANNYILLLCARNYVNHLYISIHHTLTNNLWIGYNAKPTLHWSTDRSSIFPEASRRPKPGKHLSLGTPLPALMLGRSDLDPQFRSHLLTALQTFLDQAAAPRFSFP